MCLCVLCCACACVLLCVCVCVAVRVRVCCQSQFSLDAMAIMMILRTVVAQPRSAGEERGGGDLRKISAKAFSRLTKFAKGEAHWKD